MLYAWLASRYFFQDWAQMFKDDSSMAIIQELYDSCQEQGYQFPPCQYSSSTQAAASIVSSYLVETQNNLIDVFSQATQQSVLKSSTNQVILIDS